MKIVAAKVISDGIRMYRNAAFEMKNFCSSLTKGVTETLR